MSTVLVEKIKIRLVYILTGLFILLNGIFIANELFWALLIPLGLLIVCMYFFSLNKLLYLIVFMTPLSVNVKDVFHGIGVTLPTEPLMFGVMLLFFIKLLLKERVDQRVLKHPVTIFLFIYLGWILVTSITSQLPVVSFKFLLSRLWFVICFYFIGTHLFRKIDAIKKFYWVYMIALFGVIGYTLVHHSMFGFTEKSGHWVMSPFFNDHTAYGAILAMFMPVLVFFCLFKGISRPLRILSLMLFVVLVIAIVLSYSRAAWISVAIALAVLTVILLKINYKWVLFAMLTVVVLFKGFQTDILAVLERNKQDSSTDFVEHVQSIANISSDASNLERINRWQAALRMFREKPIFGWGPGTYQFLYAPYQLAKEKTIISTNAGDKGNAHSEYIGPMAEAGIMGLLTLAALLICVIATAVKTFKHAVSSEVKYINLAALLGLISYLSHGMLNNFLDTDKASVPFWGFIAIIATLNLFHTEKGVQSEAEANGD